jgi:hypothetical protein
MKVVTIVVEGGVIQRVVCPNGVRVIVKDYDTDGTEEDNLQQDEKGEEYIEGIWEHCDASV